MADQILNIALGRIAELYNRVDLNDPTNAALIILVVSSTDTDALVKDVDDVAELLALALTAEVTNTNYARKTLVDTDLVAFAPDDTNDRVDLDIADQTFSAIAAGDNWTDLVIAYDNDTGAGTDANIVPLAWYDFVITPDGSDITAVIDAAGFFRAS